MRMANGAFAEIIKQPPIQARGRPGGHQIDSLRVVERQRMVTRHQQNSHRHIRQKRLKPRLFLRKPLGLAHHRLGQRRPRLSQAARGGRRSRGKIAQIARHRHIHFRGHIRMRPRPQRTGQDVNRLGDMGVEQKPDPSHQQQRHKPRHHPGLHKARQHLGRAKTPIAQRQPHAHGQHHAKAKGGEEQENPDTQRKPGKHLTPPRPEACALPPATLSTRTVW